MKLSIIVPAYNEEKLISACMESIQQAVRQNSRPDLQSELIVVDNNSSDRTAELARAAGARVVFEPVNQIARARNAGALQATGEWFLFVDADSFPTADLIGDVLAMIDRPDVVGGGSTVCMRNIAWSAQALVTLWNGISRTFRWAAGSFLFCRAEIFREIGGFSEALFVSEEVDLSRRIKVAGRRRGMHFVILSRHPLETSPRKLELYGCSGILKQWGIFFRHPIRSFRDKAYLDFWYDGRR